MPWLGFWLLERWRRERNSRWGRRGSGFPRVPVAFHPSPEEGTRLVPEISELLLERLSCKEEKVNEDCTQLLLEMIRIPSLSGQEGPLADFLVRWARTHGYDRAVVDEAGNAVAEVGSPGAALTLVLLGHMDTVPGDIPVRIQGRALYGRGAVDAKGPLAAFFCAVARVGRLPGVRLVVVGATEEEAATSKGARHIRDRFLTEGRPAACIIGEPSAWNRVTLGYKGRLLIDFRAQEPSTHTAGPGARGVGDRACRWWSGVKRWCEDYNNGRERLFDRVLPSLRELHTDGNGLYNEVRARVGLRLPLGLEREILEADVRSLAAEAGGEVTFWGYEPAYRASKRTSLARAFIRAIRDAGGHPAFKVKTGTSDMNVVGPAWRCPIVAYGPGDSHLDHTPNEHIDLQEYGRAIDVLVKALHYWSAAERGSPPR